MMKYPVCQSCGLPFAEESKGTNRDRSRNKYFCNHCYNMGEFCNQALTLHELEVKLMEMAKINEDITLEEAQKIIRLLPYLKRWQMSKI